MWLYLLLQKPLWVEVFIRSMLQILKTIDLNRYGCRKLIVQFSCRKMKAFWFARVISEKNTSSKTLRWEILYLFLCSGNPQTILKPLRGQLFLSTSIPTQAIFLTCFNTWINNLCSATFMFQLWLFLCFKSNINHLSC